MGSGEAKKKVWAVSFTEVRYILAKNEKEAEKIAREKYDGWDSLTEEFGLTPDDLFEDRRR